MIDALVIWLPDFTKVFEIEYDALGVGIYIILSLKHHFVAYFS